MVGHFFGVHVDGAQYNVGGAAPFFGLPKSVKDARYEGWLAGGGVTYGYQWVLGRHWNAEAAVSVGYEHLRYKKFESPEECAPQVGERSHNYWGPTKLSASIILLRSGLTLRSIMWIMILSMGFIQRAILLSVRFSHVIEQRNI